MRRATGPSDCQQMYDLVIERSTCDLSAVRAPTRDRDSHVAAAFYFLQKQLICPLPEAPVQGRLRCQRGERDLHYAFIAA